MVSAATPHPIVVDVPHGADLADAVELVAARVTRTTVLSDAHGSAEYRRGVLPTLVGDAWHDAISEESR